MSIVSAWRSNWNELVWWKLVWSEHNARQLYKTYVKEFDCSTWHANDIRWNEKNFFRLQIFWVFYIHFIRTTAAHIKTPFYILHYFVHLQSRYLALFVGRCRCRNCVPREFFLVVLQYLLILLIHNCAFIHLYIANISWV